MSDFQSLESQPKPAVTPQRRPAVEKKVSEVDPSSDRRVRLVGMVIGKDTANGMITIDDGTGKANVFFDDLKVIEKLDSYKEGDPALVVGRISQTAEGFDLNGEVIRSVKGLDFNLLEKVREKSGGKI